jgi:hypothetical protein
MFVPAQRFRSLQMSDRGARCQTDGQRKTAR